MSTTLVLMTVIHLSTTIPFIITFSLLPRKGLTTSTMTVVSRPHQTATLRCRRLLTARSDAGDSNRTDLAKRAVWRGQKREEAYRAAGTLPLREKCSYTHGPPLPITKKIEKRGPPLESATRLGLQHVHLSLLMLFFFWPLLSYYLFSFLPLDLCPYILPLLELLPNLVNGHKRREIRRCNIFITNPTGPRVPNNKKDTLM